jgi:copper chaperone CopZ
VKTKFQLEGMHCESCALDIKETLEAVAGVRGADVTFGGKTAEVDYDEAVVPGQTLIRTIQDLGYQATVAGEPQTAGPRGA